MKFTKLIQEILSALKISMTVARVYARIEGVEDNLADTPEAFALWNMFYGA
jgi:hypothetical protein